MCDFSAIKYIPFVLACVAFEFEVALYSSSSKVDDARYFSIFSFLLTLAYTDDDSLPSMFISNFLPRRFQFICGTEKELVYERRFCLKRADLSDLHPKKAITEQIL